MKKSVTSTAVQSNRSYSILDRLVHRVALGLKTVRKLSFDLDRLLTRALDKNSRQLVTDDAPIYVCGLARSGTTMLLRVLDQVESLASLSYRDMPFVMAPNLWSRINKIGHKEATLSERAHGDGIEVGYDSPEAFEEIFWQTYCEPNSRSTACYGLTEPSAQVLSDFAEYRQIVVRSKEEPISDHKTLRYLSKNNNNLTRLPSLLKERTAKILLVYRDPIETAKSLLRQHQRFLVRQNEDGFALQYMGWLGHHEFGIDFKPFCFATRMQNTSLKPDTIEYWLDYWNAVYLHVLDQKSEQILLAHHDSMRAEPEKFLTNILQRLELEADALELSKEINPQLATHKSIPKDISSEIIESAYLTYRSLLADLRNVLITNKSEIHG